MLRHFRQTGRLLMWGLWNLATFRKVAHPARFQPQISADCCLGKPLTCPTCPTCPTCISDVLLSCQLCTRNGSSLNFAGLEFVIWLAKCQALQHGVENCHSKIIMNHSLESCSMVLVRRFLDFDPALLMRFKAEPLSLQPQELGFFLQF